MFILGGVGAFGKIQAGQELLIIGSSGSIGSAGVRLAKHFGARVTAVCSSANVDLVKSLGENRVIDDTKEDFTSRTNTYDLIFDIVGATNFRRCRHALQPRESLIFKTPSSSMKPRRLNAFMKKLTRDRVIGKGVVSVQHANHLLFGNDQDGRGRHRRCRFEATGTTCERILAEEVTRLEHRDDALFTAVRQHRKLLQSLRSVSIERRLVSSASIV